MAEELYWVVEYAAFALMLGLSTVIGLYYGFVEGKQNTVSEYLMGSKHMSVFPITMSLIVSHVSGITILGIPVEIYNYGTQLLIMCIANVGVIAIVMYIFLPVFYELQLISVYEYLEYRFDFNIRGLSSLIFALYLILYIPLVIYIPALAFNQVTGLHLQIVTVIISGICIFYTSIGGLKAVVWTDAIQSVFTSASIVIVIILGLIEVGGFGSMLKSNLDGDRIELFKMDPDPFLRNTFWTVSIGMSLHWITNLGIQPGAVQRFNTLPTYKQAQKTLVYFLLGIVVINVLTGIIGMLIYAKYKDCDPIMANHIKSERYLVPYFVMDVAAKFPGVTGLFVSGIISSALSTMSAQLNTVSGTIYKDFIVKFLKFEVSETTASIIMKCTVVVIGFICASLVLVVDKLKGIIQMSTSFASITNGALLSVFTLGMCFPWANSRGAMCGMIASSAVTAWIITGAQFAIFNNELKFVEKNVSVVGCPANTSFKNITDYSGLYQLNDDVYVSPNVSKIYTISYTHYTTIGTIVGLVVGLIVSLLFPTDKNVDPKLLTPFVRKMYLKYNTRAKLTAAINADEYKPVSQSTKL